MVAIELSPEPTVCDRRIIVLADSAIPGSKQPFHTAEPMPLPKAKAFLKRCEERSYELAVASVRDVLSSWKKRGREVVACGLIASSGRVPDSIEAILASHAAIHSAEGELYRDAVAYACERCRLPLLRVKLKEVFLAAEASLHKPSAQIRSALASMGREAGPPWAEDQKLAALAAWIALVASGARRKAAGARA